MCSNKQIKETQAEYKTVVPFIQRYVTTKETGRNYDMENK